jgi:hypothetical protein
MIARRHDPRQDRPCILHAVPLLVTRLRVARYSLPLPLALPTIIRFRTRLFNCLLTLIPAFPAFLVWHADEVTVYLCHGWDPRQLRLYEDLLLHAQRSSVKHAPCTHSPVLDILTLPWEEMSKRKLCHEATNHASVASTS